jgi:hypothetical protein
MREGPPATHRTPGSQGRTRALRGRPCCCRCWGRAASPRTTHRAPSPTAGEGGAGAAGVEGGSLAWGRAAGRQTAQLPRKPQGRGERGEESARGPTVAGACGRGVPLATHTHIGPRREPRVLYEPGRSEAGPRRPPRRRRCGHQPGSANRAARSRASARCRRAGCGGRWACPSARGATSGPWPTRSGHLGGARGAGRPRLGARGRGASRGMATPLASFPRPLPQPPAVLPASAPPVSLATGGVAQCTSSSEGARRRAVAGQFPAHLRTRARRSRRRSTPGV